MACGLSMQCGRMASAHASGEVCRRLHQRSPQPAFPLHPPRLGPRAPPPSCILLSLTRCHIPTCTCWSGCSTASLRRRSGSVTVLGLGPLHPCVPTALRSHCPSPPGLWAAVRQPGLACPAGWPCQPGGEDSPAPRPAPPLADAFTDSGCGWSPRGGCFAQQEGGPGPTQHLGYPEDPDLATMGGGGQEQAGG